MWQQNKTVQYIHQGLKTENVILICYPIISSIISEGWLRTEFESRISMGLFIATHNHIVGSCMQIHLQVTTMIILMSSYGIILMYIYKRLKRTCIHQFPY